jgi:hypothetical protein
METESTPGAEVLPLKTIRVETALSRYPVHRLARKGDIRIELHEGDHGATLKWKVSYNSDYGQPGPLAYKIDTLIITAGLRKPSAPFQR